MVRLGEVVPSGRRSRLETRAAAFVRRLEAIRPPSDSMIDLFIGADERTTVDSV